MTSQNFMQNRRKFLKHSALGATGALLLPSFLASCTDHNIDPNPAGPSIIYPPLTDSAIAWNDDAKIMVTSFIEMIPEAGDILGGLVDIFWPGSGDDVWGQIRSQVEALVDKKIEENTYLEVSNDLTGLKNSLILYLSEVQHGSPATILDQWMISRNLFVNALPHFQSAGYELPLLPLFGQFANMYLALLRDGVAFGISWGMTTGDQNQLVQDLKNNIAEFYSYTARIYNTGRANVIKNTKADFHACEPFRTMNIYDRQMTLTVLNFLDTWPYYDVSAYPNGTTPILTRETFSDPMGTCDDSGNIVISIPPPTQPINTISVWGGDFFNAVQVTYPAGSGPGGVTQTRRMGAPNGHNDVINISAANPINSVETTYGSVVNTIKFTYVDGTTTNHFGSVAGSNDVHWSFEGQILSSIHINGESSFYKSADSVVYGFQNWQSPKSLLRAIGILYVKSPKERSAADFAKAFPKLSIPANAITAELSAARKVYWDSIKERAEAIK